MRFFLKNIVICVLLIFWGCSGRTSSEIESSVQDAEMAVAQGDMESATSIATKITEGKNLSGLSAEQLARLSIVYMQIADADDSASDDNIAMAADLYRQAYITNPAQADSFYNENSDVDKMRHIVKLSTLVTSIDHPTKIDLDNDSLPVDGEWQHE